MPPQKYLSLSALCSDAIHGHLPRSDNVPFTIKPVEMPETPQEFDCALTDSAEIVNKTKIILSCIVDAYSFDGDRRMSAFCDHTKLVLTHKGNLGLGVWVDL